MHRRQFLQSVAAVPFIPARSVRSCILLQLTGGPSHLDTWDPKPDAPREVRSPFRAIRTNVPGMRISEFFPRMARHADKYSLIRSLHHDAPPHHESGVTLLDAALPGATRLPASRGFARNCRIARELVESGTRFVTVPMYDSVFHEPTWDAHGAKFFSTLEHHRTHAAPIFDAAFTTLLQELTDRGLLATTLVLATGEFGRTPRLNPQGGRDHWPRCWTAVIAGGGIPGGEIYGSSDATGSEPRDNPIALPDLLAAVDSLPTEYHWTRDFSRVRCAAG